MRRICSIFLALFMLCSVIPVWASAASNDNPVPKAKQGVVSILAGVSYDSNGELTYVDEEAGQGTGFGVGLEGTSAKTFVTNCHVVSVGSKICETVYLLIDGADVYDGNTLIACKVIYADSDIDFAVIQADKPIAGVATLPLLPAEKMQTGESVFTLGFPGIADVVADNNQYTADDITVTDGIISRYLTSGGVACMAHTAAVNHGNSGGPLINEAGQVIGINSFIYYNNEEPDLRNYAIYIDYAMAALDELEIEYVDASKTVQQEEEVASEQSYGIVIAAVAGAVAVSVIFVVVGKRKKEEQLVVMGASGLLKGQTWELKDTLRVGRDPSGDIVYPPDTKGVSRNHCTIRVYKDGNEKYIEVTDAGSSFGTYNYGSNLRWLNTKMPAKNVFFRFSVGSDENSLVITSKLLAAKMEETAHVGGK